VLASASTWVAASNDVIVRSEADRAAGDVARAPAEAVGLDLDFAG
jgi:hypothetical protein